VPLPCPPWLILQGSPRAWCSGRACPFGLWCRVASSAPLFRGRTLQGRWWLLARRWLFWNREQPRRGRLQRRWQRFRRGRRWRFWRRRSIRRLVMAHTTHTFFTQKEKERIQATTNGVESRTIGEVAVMVVDSSDHYPEAEVTGGVLLGSLLSLWITASYFHSSVWWYVPLSFLLFFPSRLLFRKVPALKVAL